jgi:hypothetical protein
VGGGAGGAAKALPAVASAATVTRIKGNFCMVPEDGAPRPQTPGARLANL